MASAPAQAIRFDGDAYDPDRDGFRLTRQMDRVWTIMRDGEPRTLSEIQDEIEEVFGQADPLPSISARLRDLRKPKWGGKSIDKDYVGNGQYVYFLLNPVMEA